MLLPFVDGLFWFHDDAHGLLRASSLTWKTFLVWHGGFAFMPGGDFAVFDLIHLLAPCVRRFINMMILDYI